jgi:hypothetical protein
MVIHGFRNQQNVPAKNYNCNASVMLLAKAVQSLSSRYGTVVAMQGGFVPQSIANSLTNIIMSTEPRNYIESEMSKGQRRPSSKKNQGKNRDPERQIAHFKKRDDHRNRGTQRSEKATNEKWFTPRLRAREL